ncbi:PDZ and LIM domain protein 3 [Xylocopa sonorina]|uniref:PDZ and LIM domain protein 3 n=1 Tax=Xylocopa sonorina TaxID=1818115 RepID=UPI00403B36AB
MTAMDVDITLSRTCNHAWGFRLSGGADFSFPVTVVRVTLGALADRAGLKAGDIVTKVNGKNVQQLRHCDVEDLIVKAGDRFTLSVIRNLKFERNV